MKALVVGSGGREHALAWRLAREGVQVVVAPGNAGTSRSAAVSATDIDDLLLLARREQVDLTIVGPEMPLAMGIADTFGGAGQAVFGPTQAAARLEWSKVWAKAFFSRHGIPTASAQAVADEAAARRAIARMGLPVVLKADGLAAGKGVFVAQTADHVETAVEHLFRAARFGQAADQVLIEEWLQGPELSVLAFTDGERLALMPPARDYKRLGDGDSGPNTGGMGGVTWPRYATADVLERIERELVRPTLAGMAAEGEPYRGVLYAGVMLTSAGPKILEYNCRFGDPECQLIVPLLAGSLFETCASIAGGRLDRSAVRWTNGRTYGVVLAAPGYPDAPRLGDPIAGLDDTPATVHVFQAGTRRGDDGLVLTAGGRVLTLVGSDRTNVYRAAEAIQFEGKQFRHDIGQGESNAVSIEASPAASLSAGVLRG